MKLLFVGTTRGFGGRESHFVTLAQAMARAGHTVQAVVHPVSPIRLRLESSGIMLHYGAFRNAMDPRGIAAVLRAASGFRPDWIVGGFAKEYWPLAIASKLLRVKLAVFKQMDFEMRPLTHRYLPRLADRFIVVSEFLRQRFVERGVPASRIQVLFNPVDVEFYHGDAVLRRVTREKLGFEPSDTVFGYAGAIDEHKGVLRYAEALDKSMSAVPTLRALWVGDGPAKELLNTRIETGGFADRHVRTSLVTDVRPMLAAMDVLALPSIRPEAFGRILIEAQACGVPVIGSDIGGIPEALIPNSTGLLLPPENEPAWCDAIRTLAGDAKRRQQMADAGRDWVTRTFGMHVIADQFAAMLTAGRAR